jgi:enterochelin esterase-like enzyme
MRALAVAAALLALAAAGAPRSEARARVLPAGWGEVRSGPAGGAVYVGRIPDEFVPSDHRLSAVYLPPGFDPAQSYPVVYLLHGMRGDPSGYWDSMHLATVADGLISGGRAVPFIAVMPVAGPTVHPDSGEWAGVWEDYVVQDVVPWVDSHLPTIATPQGRALEGLCAGGYGAMDIGLRHPGVFGTLGSFEGYFAPVFRDGPFVHASSADLAAHDPELLVQREAATQRQAGVRFYVSVGGNHAQVLGRWTIEFANELSSLRLPHELWVASAAQRRHFWAATFPSALVYAADGFPS